MVLQALACSVAISLGFLFFIYVGVEGRNRNDPAVAKLRCVRVLLLSIATPIFVYLVYEDEFYTGVSYPQLLGIRFEGLLLAAIVPLALTMLFYLAPIVMHFVLDKYYVLLLEPHYWRVSLNDPLWVRDHMCAPFAEEICFRACLLPLIFPHFGLVGSMILGPVLFGLCHVHHFIERLHSFGLKDALLVTLTQLCFTTLFGMYTSFLFLRTGHILPCILVHAFCNYMGVPQLPTNRPYVSFLYVIGIGGWCLLIKSSTRPELYSNSIFSA